MQADGPRDPDLEEFLERAQPAGQDDERVGAGVHLRLALAHVVGDDEFAQPLGREFEVHERLRHDPGGPGPRGPGRGLGRPMTEVPPPP